MPNEQRLLDVASTLAQGSDVDWQEVERQAVDGGDLPVLRALHVLANIADVAQSPTSTSTGSPWQDSSGAPTTPPATWGHLRILDQIGAGSFGVVYRAFDTRLECEVALKLARPSAAPPEFDLSRSLKEARVLARVRHPGVVSAFGADCHDSRFGLWMELVEGRTLKDHLALNGTMSAHEAASVGVDLCHALAAVHRARLLHRDIKATNVMREDGGRIVLMDFGTVRRIPAPDEPTGSLAGTAQYLAPELLAGKNPSVSSDVYSLGVLLFHLVSGEYPVQGSSADELMVAHHRARVSLRDLRPNLPSSFTDVVERALSLDPKDRYQTAGQFGAALAGVAGIRYEPDPVRLSAWKVAAGIVVGLALVAGMVELVRNASTEAGNALDPTALLRAPASAATYEVAASLYAVRNGQNVRLMPGNRVQPGDQLFLSLEASQTVFVYVVNQDEIGNAYLLFPLPGYEPGNPIPLGRTTRLPGSRNGEQHFWQVTSAGGREHFLVYVTPERLTGFEQVLAALPRAELGRPVEHVALSAAAIGALRGVGGVRPAPAATSSAAPLIELELLPATGEIATGVWARRITLDNPFK